MDTDPDPGYFFKILIFFNKTKFSNFLSDFFMLKLDEPFRNQEIFKSSLCSIVQIWVERKILLISVFG